MPRTFLTLPEELILRILALLYRLDDLYSVMLTNKLFHRISHNVLPADISRMALQTENILPGLRPYQHFLLIPSARRLAGWAVQSDERRRKLASAMHGGIDGLLAIAMEEAPVALDDLRKTWHWKQNVLIPLSDKVDKACGRPSQPNDFCTVCENPPLMLLTWVIYGELFHHSISYLYAPDDTQHPIPFDCVTRFKFLVYCVPDDNSFTYMDVEVPTWFQSVAEAADRYQQLSLNHAKRVLLLPSLWSQEMNELMPGVLSDYGDMDWDFERLTKDRLLVFTVLSSGTRALDILQAGRLKRKENIEPSQDLARWLHNLHQEIDALPSVDTEIGDIGCRPPYDPWLGQTWVTLPWDQATTLWDAGPYSLRDEVCKQYGEELAAWDAVRRAIGEDLSHS